MAVEVNDRDWSVGSVDGPQQRECDGVVAAQGDNTGERLAAFRRAELVSVGGRGAIEDVKVALFDLVQSPRVVVPSRSLVVNSSHVYESGFERCAHLRGHRDITAVDHLCPAVKGVCIQRDVVPSAEATSVLEEGWLRKGSDLRKDTH